MLGLGLGLGSSAPQPLWTPLILGSALVAWWDASDASTITLNGSSVSAWASKVGGVTASQATGANQPAYSATARNGRPGITADGSNDRLEFTPTGLPSGSTASTIVAVGYSAAMGWRRLLAYGAAVAAQARSLMVSSTGYVMGTMEGSVYDLISTSYQWASNDRIVGFSSPAGANPTLSLFTDGNAAETKAVTGTPNTVLTTGRIFCGVSTNEFWQGTAQDLLIISRVLTTDERQKLEGYLAHKWGLAANLPALHPYKSGAPRA